MKTYPDNHQYFLKRFFRALLVAGVISSALNAQSAVKILAVMVEFQKDNDATTAGNGLFDSLYSVDWGKHILDPLPHDSAYFARHLLFAKNYFNRVSDGKVSVSYTLLPARVKVSKTMKNYSPPVNSSDFRPIAELMTEVWKAVDSIYPSLNFTQYNLFTIFHAGVGRDVSLPGSLGNERDIPSLFVGMKTLREIYGGSYPGISVKNGAYFILNSMILPQTENREEESFGKKYLTQLSFNGLIASNIGSFLTLPDLFDTKTGLSAIGRFGLMDGQAIFAYSGLFPPEPSAWEKIYLGWESPVTLLPGNYPSLGLVTHAVKQAADTSIVKIIINADEYYLIENRQRDAKNDGSKITYISGDTIYTKTFLKDTTGFYSYRVDSLRGVVVDVDEYDWAVPGSGLCIWHIDESVIRAKISGNEINADKTHRGIELEEADGIKDIGNQFTTILGDVVTGEGAKEDLWYKGNEAQLYKNAFNKNTRPSTRAYTGANSLITIDDFSISTNRMTFALTYGTDEIKPYLNRVITIPSSSGLKIFPENYLGQQAICIQSGESLIVLDTLGNELKTLPKFSKHTPVFAGDVIFGTMDSVINVFRNGTTKSFPGFSSLSCAVAAYEQYGISDITVYAGTNDGKVFKYSYNPTANRWVTAPEPVISDTRKISRITGTREICMASAGDTTSGSILCSNGLKVSFTSPVSTFFSYLSKDNKLISVALLKDSRVAVIHPDGLHKLFPIASGAITDFSLIDLKLDGNPYAVLTADGKIFAYNLEGAGAEFFPVSLTAGGGYLFAAYDQLEKDVRMYSLNSSGLSAHSAKDGRSLPDFPLAFSTENARGALMLLNGKLLIVKLENAGLLSLWQLSTRNSDIIFNTATSVRNPGMIPLLPASKLLSSFLPKDKTYNYPNPVYGGTTYIRSYVNEDARITVNIFDYAGDLAATLTATARGGLETEIPWNVSGIQSGVYLAHIEAVGSSGKTETAIIKIAVIK